MKLVKKGIMLALVAQLAYVGLAMAKQCTSCKPNADGTYTCTGCVD